MKVTVKLALCAVLATVFPDAHFTLCDSIGKKVRVAQAVATPS